MLAVVAIDGLSLILLTLLLPILPYSHRNCPFTAAHHAIANLVGATLCMARSVIIGNISVFLYLGTSRWQ